MTIKKKTTKRKVVAKKAVKKVVAKKAVKKVVAKKAVKKVVAKKAVTTRFNSKTHVKLSDLATNLKMDYRSMFAKQARLGIKASKYLESGRDVLAFTNSDAKKIRKMTASMMTDARLELSQVEGKFKVTRSVLLRVLKSLKISPIKYRRKDDKRSVPTIPKGSLSKIKKALAKSA